ncbi:Lipoprotein-anchoring transpeptidase ErfK/SrfK [Streptosporangium canum]|uniref:Lipoprotein-anchoring transpeptidase ErfK/SrfK n=1 Tax=Streptosporangium canum TaxID=324952 RepID=A0A1I3VYX4_9ACTN|nr:L,D-transpeptidase [Streptosporangium canum]SFK00584.1 Lipoprotein-anchoring transpeptidase ErfK/SrfK [Streptosporangium canum]
MKFNGYLATAALVTVATLTGCAASGTQPAPPRAAASTATGQAGTGAGVEVATVRGPRIAVYQRKGASSPWRELASPNDYGAERVFLVERRDGEWLRVLLPIRPNGSTGWIRAGDVTLARTTHRAEVDPARFRFTVYDGARVLRTGKVATGRDGTPTPPGRYFFTELVRPPDPHGPYGAYAFGLSGFSPTLKSFAGGPGQLAIHGTDDAAALGTQVSHGCVRVGNADITWMAENLAIGTPVVLKG